MRNEELFTDPKDAEIARLKLEIQAFKKYDLKRGKYYADKMQRLGELESLLLEHDPKEEMEKMRKEIIHYSKMIQAYHIEDNRTDEELSEAITIDSLRKRNKYLNEELSKLRSEKSKIATELIKMRNEENKA